MTRVRMLTTAAGPSFQASVGAELDLPDALALALVRAGAAEVFEAAAAPPARPVVEVAAIAPEETAEAIPKRPAPRKGIR